MKKIKHAVIDIKTGTPKSFHRLTTTGYALALENYYGRDSRFDIGCIFYVNFNEGSDVPIIDCDIYPITNAVRKEFIEERNTKIEIVAENKDPGFPEDESRCPKNENCPYWVHCKELVQ